MSNVLLQEQAKELTADQEKMTLQQMLDTKTKSFDVKLSYCEKRSHRTEYPYLYYTNLVFDNPATNVTAPVYYDGPNKVFCYNDVYNSQPIRKNLENDVSYDRDYMSTIMTSTNGTLKEREKLREADLPSIEIVENGKKIGVMETVLDTYFDDNEAKITNTNNRVLDSNIIYYLQPTNMMREEMMPYAKELPVVEKEKIKGDPAVPGGIRPITPADPAVPEISIKIPAEPAVPDVRDPVGGKRRKTARKNKNKSKKSSKKFRKYRK
jgi:hypothetical protein